MHVSPLKPHGTTARCLPLTFRVAEGGGSLPEYIKVLGWGENKNSKGLRVIVNELTAARLPEWQREMGREEIALDYEHNTVEGTPAYLNSKEPREVAGFGGLVVRPGEGVFQGPMKFTPSGSSNLVHFPDVSPAVVLNDQGVVIGLHSAGLCRNGAIYDLHTFNVSPVTGDNPNPKDEPMDVTKKIEELEAALAEMKNALSELNKPEKVEEMATAAAKKEVETFSATFNAKMEGYDRAEIIREAQACGKVIPLSAEEVAKTPVATLRSMVGKLKPEVPLTRLTPEGGVATLSAGDPAAAENARAARIRDKAEEIAKREKISLQQAWPRAEQLAG